MKKLIAIMCLVFCGFNLCACGEKNEDILRIHIRANSNSEVDQSIKLNVRDKIIDYITPLISGCKDCDDVKVVLGSSLDKIESIADDVLCEGGFEYVAKASIRNEYFPTRSYEGNVFPADYYDALIVELGTGTGDNWWCVAYPPLCFVGEDVDGNNFRYKSKLIELINKYFG